LCGLETPLVSTELPPWPGCRRASRLAAHYPLATARSAFAVSAPFASNVAHSRPGGSSRSDRYCWEFRGVLLGDAAGNENAEMADALVNRVDDGLSVGPDLVDVGVEIEYPVQGCCAGDVVALGAETTIGDLILRRSTVSPFDILMRPGSEIVADEQFIDDELNLLGIQVDVAAPPALEFEVAIGLVSTFETRLYCLLHSVFDGFWFSKFCTSQAPSNLPPPRSPVSAVSSFPPSKPPE